MAKYKLKDVVELFENSEVNIGDYFMTSCGSLNRIESISSHFVQTEEHEYCIGFSDIPPVRD